MHKKISLIVYLYLNIYLILFFIEMRINTLILIELNKLIRCNTKGRISYPSTYTIDTFYLGRVCEVLNSKV